VDTRKRLSSRLMLACVIGLAALQTVVPNHSVSQ